MKTKLQLQLDALASNSTNPLDLRAQRRAHSQSLIFEPRDAAVQDFDTIYDVCVDGFRELCLLEPRFVPFSRNIFADHSKSQDRSQMTSAQNEELDTVVERFLYLVGSKVLVQPAIKAIEWLVRRFRIHEYSTLCLILTFLPYHTLPIFATLLSIVPKKLSPTTKFLHPYLESLASPPRHVIAYAATNNVAFFTAWNNYVLKSCKEKTFSQAMISYWATTMTEAVIGQLDQAASTRREAQRQKEEDILLRILPVLNKGLAMRSVPDMRVGCYMILSVMVSRTNLDDKVLLGLTEAVLSGGTKETSHAELICIAVLLQQRASTDLPSSIYQRLMSIDTLVDDLMTMSERYRVNHLAFSVASGSVQQAESGQAPQHQDLIASCLHKDLLTKVQISALAKRTISVAKATEPSSSSLPTVIGYLAKIAQDMLASDTARSTFEHVLEEMDMDLQNLEVLFDIALPQYRDGEPMAIEESQVQEPTESRRVVTYDSMKAGIMADLTTETPLLHDGVSEPFNRLAAAFTLALRDDSNAQDFIELPIIQGPEVVGFTFSLSFFTRFWCSSFPSTAKVAALDSFAKILGASRAVADTQFVLPYAFYALSDPSKIVRGAATRALLSLGDRYLKLDKLASMPILGRDKLYNSNVTSDISWLSPQQVATLIHEVLFPVLEECTLDRSRIFNVLRETLNKTQKVENTVSKSKARKSSFRASLLGFIASHINGTPLYSVKSMLLRVLDGVSKAGGITKTELLSPLLRTHLQGRESDFIKSCQRERLDTKQFASELLAVVSHSSMEGNDLLQTLLSNYDSVPSELWEIAVFQHVKVTWDVMRPEIQRSWASTLFDIGVLAFSSTDLDGRNRRQSARDVLLNVTLSTDSLLDYLGLLPRLVIDTEQQSPSSKRRKTGQGMVESRANSGENQLSDRLSKTTTVLELIEVSEHGNDIRLLPRLFQILHDLQRCVTAIGNDMGYALSTLLRSMTKITEHSRSSKASLIEQQSIRVDLVIDCFKNTGSLQVQQEALRLLSSLALLAPDLIVHSVMPIFTFMGGSMLRQSDEHSARIVDSTIESVIPPLISTFRKRKAGVLGGAAELILSFAAAFEHIPVHRRLELLTALMKKLGEEDYLYVLLIILVDRHGRKSTILDFCTDMMLQYPPIVQLKAIHSCMEVAIDSFKPEPRITPQILSSDRDKDQEITRGSLIGLSSHLLLNPQLSNRLAKVLCKNDEAAAEIRNLYSKMVEQALHLTEQAKQIFNLHGSCSSLLNALSDFLPLSASLTSLHPLLEHESEALRRQVLRSFEQRINSARPGDVATEKACFDLLPRLLLLLDNSQDTSIKRMAIAVIDKIADKYGKRNTSAISEVATAISSNSCLGSEDLQVQVMALLCIITIVEVLREAIVSIIPSILPRSLDLLAISVHSKDRRSSLHNAVFRVFDALFLYLPWAVTGKHLHRLLELSYESACSDMNDECRQIRADSLDLLAKQVEAHQCIDALHHTWAEAMDRGIDSVLEHLKVLQKVIERHPKSIIVKESHLLTKRILTVMDLRRTQEYTKEQSLWSAQHLQQVESTIDGITIQMVYKLNDTHFRPLFGKMSDWATELRSKKDLNAKTCRELSWFSFLQHFFSTLESIVTSYAAYVLDEAVDILASSNSSIPSHPLLRDRTIKTLRAMFEHDQDEFWRSTSRFDTVCSPLLAQLKLTSSRELDSTLISCITSFATATDSPDHLKIINSKILEHLRSDAAKVRLAAIRCEISLTESLGEEWLSLLPEMLPAISEVMEDDDEGVEKEVRKWAKQIEGILGESLDDMLQ